MLNGLRWKIRTRVREVRAALGRLVHPKGQPYPQLKDPELWVNWAVTRWSAIPMDFDGNPLSKWEFRGLRPYRRKWIDFNEVARVLIPGGHFYLTDTFRTHPGIPIDIIGCHFESDWPITMVEVRSSYSKIMGNLVVNRAGKNKFVTVDPDDESTDLAYT